MAGIPDKHKVINSDLNDWTEDFNILLVIICLIIGFIAIGIYSIRVKCDETINGLFSELSLLALASLITGSILGFLFGMPKTTQPSNSDVKKTTFLINTNLEQISDWLTKIIVGLGLIQLKGLPKNINDLSLTLQKNIGGGQINDVGLVGICIIIYFLLFGFFALYMYTRINLSYQFLRNSIDQDKLANPEVTKPTEALPEEKQPKIKKP